MKVTKKDTVTADADAVTDADVCASSSAGSTSGSGSPFSSFSKVDLVNVSDNGMWLVVGQAVCVVHPRIMLTATHVCFDGTTLCKHIKVLYTPIDGSPPQSFSAELIRYSGIMDVAVMLLHTGPSSSPFLPVDIAASNCSLFKSAQTATLACFPLIGDFVYSSCRSGNLLLANASQLTRVSHLFAGEIIQTTVREIFHQDTSRHFATITSTYPFFHACSGGGVFSLKLSQDGKPQLLAIHTSASYQTAYSQLNIVNLVKGEFDGETVGSQSHSHKRQGENESSKPVSTVTVSTAPEEVPS